MITGRLVIPLTENKDSDFEMKMTIVVYFLLENQTQFDLGNMLSNQSEIYVWNS